MNKVGIFPGSFDPVHSGHIAFALEAIKKANLNEVYFLPEVKPRFKPGVSHISHRVAMLEIATKPYRQLKILELPDKQFTVKATVTKLKRRFGGADLFLLVGSDVGGHIKEWDNADKLLEEMNLIIAKRGEEKAGGDFFDKNKTIVLRSREPGISSSEIREAARSGKRAKGCLSSVDDYIKNNWIYSEVPKSS